MKSGESTDNRLIGPGSNDYGRSETRYGGGSYQCELCGQMHYGSTIHVCGENMPHIEEISPERKDNTLLDNFIDKLSKANVKVVFGLEQQGHIDVIEKIIKEHGNSVWVWKEKIAPEIGWDAFTACTYYLDYILEKQSK